MPFIGYAVVFILAACGGGALSELFMNVLSTSIVDFAGNNNSKINPPAGTTGTMCVYYQEEDCNGTYVRNGLEYLAEQKGVSIYPPFNAPETFIPTTTNAPNLEYALSCADFTVGQNGKIEVFAGMNASNQPTFKSNANFKLRAKNPYCTTDVKIKNVHLVAILRNNPARIYVSNPLFSETCIADGGSAVSRSESKTCNADVQSAELRFDTYSLIANWPIKNKWVSGGLDWFTK